MHTEVKGEPERAVEVSRAQLTEEHGPPQLPVTDRTLHPHLQPQLLTTQVTPLPQAAGTLAWACSADATICRPVSVF